MVGGERGVDGIGGWGGLRYVGGLRVGACGGRF